MGEKELPSNPKPNRTVDCTGLYCPEPVYRTRTELDEMEVGEVLEVIVDDPAAEEDLKSLVKYLGQATLRIHKEGTVLQVLIRKTK
ncbi:MAG: sulfurtransferase TusA family protein [Candidatus Bathyarchaeota archaeon]